MAHYAFLDENQIVTEVIVGKDEMEDGIDWEERYAEIRGQVCKRTSYNTRGGMHENGGVPFRKNYAGIGYFYDLERDAFIPPKQHEGWMLNETSCLWEPPIPMPMNGNWEWDKELKDWIPVGE